MWVPGTWLQQVAVGIAWPSLSLQRGDAINLYPACCKMEETSFFVPSFWFTFKSSVCLSVPHPLLSLLSSLAPSLSLNPLSAASEPDNRNFVYLRNKLEGAGSRAFYSIHTNEFLQKALFLVRLPD